MSERQRNAPGAGAHVHCPKRAVFPVARARGEFEDALDNVLGLGPGNQNVRRDLEIQAPKSLMPGDVLSGLAGGALFDHAEVSLERFRGNFRFRVRVEVAAVAAERVHQKQFCGELGRRHMVREESLQALLKCAPKLHGSVMRGFRSQDSGSRIQGSGAGIQGSGAGIQDSGLSSRHCRLLLRPANMRPTSLS